MFIVYNIDAINDARVLSKAIFIDNDELIVRNINSLSLSK